MRALDSGISGSADVFGLFPDTAAIGAAVTALRRAGVSARDVRVLMAAGADRLVAIGLAEADARRFAAALGAGGAALLAVVAGDRATGVEAILARHGGATARAPAPPPGGEALPRGAAAPATGALAGAAAGAVAGATAGAVVGGPVGSVIGGILGAAGAASAGEAIQRRADGVEEAPAKQTGVEEEA